MTSIIPHIPDWILFFSVFIIFFIIYRYVLDEEMKVYARNLIRDYGVLIILACLLLYGWHRWGIVADHDWIASMKYAFFMICFIGLLYFAASSYLYEQRYVTNAFVANGAYGSCAKYFDVGRYTVFYLGTSGKSDYRGFVLPWGWPQKIVVLPKQSWRFIGNCIVSTTQVFKRDIEKLPSDQIRRLIEADSLTWFARDEIYFGIFSEELRTEDPTVDEVESRYLDVNTLNTLQKSMIEGKNTILKKHITDTEAMKNKLKGARPQPVRVASNPEE